MAVPLSSCVTFGKSLNLSKPPSIKMEYSYHMRLRGLKEKMFQGLGFDRWFTTFIFKTCIHSEHYYGACARG